jgi:hypothetical protein
MVEGTDKTEEGVKTEREEIFSKSVRAGKRTYFFDVKTTRRNDYYLTLTESKKRFNRDGRFYFEKHKIFLYKEDFEKFTDGLSEAIGYIKANAPEILEPEEVQEEVLNEAPAAETIEVTAPDAAEPVSEAEPETKAETDAEAEESAGESPVAEETAETGVETEVGEAITENFSNVEFEDLDDSTKS